MSEAPGVPLRTTRHGACGERLTPALRYAEDPIAHDPVEDPPASSKRGNALLRVTKSRLACWQADTGHRPDGTNACGLVVKSEVPYEIQLSLRRRANIDGGPPDNFLPAITEQGEEATITRARLFETVAGPLSARSPVVEGRCCRDERSRSVSSQRRRVNLTRRVTVQSTPSNFGWKDYASCCCHDYVGHIHRPHTP